MKEENLTITVEQANNVLKVLLEMPAKNSLAAIDILRSLKPTIKEEND